MFPIPHFASLTGQGLRVPLIFSLWVTRNLCAGVGLDIGCLLVPLNSTERVTWPLFNRILNWDQDTSWVLCPGLWRVTQNLHMQFSLHPRSPGATTSLTLGFRLSLIGRYYSSSLLQTLGQDFGIPSSCALRGIGRIGVELGRHLWFPHKPIPVNCPLPPLNSSLSLDALKCLAHTGLLGTPLADPGLRGGPGL